MARITEREIIEALAAAQAVLNPLSGFLRKGTPITRRYLETVRDQIDAALAKMIVKAASATGKIVTFPKAKRPIPAAMFPLAGTGEGVEIPENTRQADGNINTCVNKRPSWGVFDDTDGDTPDAA